MQIVFDFVEGKVSFDEFWNAWTTQPEIGQWLDQVADLCAMPAPPGEGIPYSAYRASIKKFCGGSVVRFLKKQLYSTTEYVPQKSIIQSAIFCGVVVALTTSYHDIKPTDFYLREREFYFLSIGDAIGGYEVDAYIDMILQKFPPSMGKTKRIKAAKENLKLAFHIEGGKFPHWAQEADWPMGKNSPMEYLSQRKDGELVELRFRDVDTGEERVVEQFY